VLDRQPEQAKASVVGPVRRLERVEGDERTDIDVELGEQPGQAGEERVVGRPVRKVHLDGHLTG
jgi:hypothetical protein